MSAEDEARYERAAHAMQSGVAAEIEYGIGAADPKHLRVGVNSALVSAAAVAGLLMAKGIITQDELDAALAEQMEAEQKSYESRLSQYLEAQVKLR